MKYLQIISAIGLGLCVGVAATVFYYNELNSSDTVIKAIQSEGLATKNTLKPAVSLPPPSAETLARIKELEEATAHLVKLPEGESMSPPVKEVKNRLTGYVPAPAIPSILSEQDRRHAELTQVLPQEVGDFIDADSPYQVENDLVGEPSKPLTE